MKTESKKTYIGLFSALGYAVIVGADMLLKSWCAANIKGATDVPLIPGVIRLTYTENTGAAFSVLEGGRWFFVWLGVAVVIALLLLIRFDKHLRGSKWVMASVTLMMAGTTGNLLDRLFQGYVIDMFHPEFVRFATFNIADAALTLGGVGFCSYILFSKAYKRPAPASEP